MKRKEPRCPKCQDAGKVSGSLKCETCGEQLEYYDLDGTLRVAERERRCPRCDTVNSKDVKFCESCGAQIGKYCGYCKTYHFIEDKVCPRTGEPIKSEEKEVVTAGILPKILIAASIIAMLFFGYMVYRSSRTPAPIAVTPVILVTASPIPVVIQPTAVPITPVVQPRIDVVFMVDATGSMGDEIEVVKSKIREMVRTIASGQPAPHVRYGLVAYRDRGDTFVTKKYELSDSLNNITENINQLYADGGGDTPESVNEALHVAVNEMNWDSSANTRKMIFLIGDAGPHMDYAQDYNYKDVSRQAKSKGIKVYTIGCSGITSSGESEFREIAQITGGTFDYLTYQQVYTKRDGTEMIVLKAGDTTYHQVGGRKDDYKFGYREMLRSKKAVEMPASSAGAMMDRSEIRSTSELKNNLDTALTRQVQMEAEAMGVKYKK